MTVQLISSYLIGVVGAVIGFGVGLVLITLRERVTTAQDAITNWDSRVTIPLLLAAGGGHVVLIPAMSSQNQVLFGLYFVALILVVIVAFAGFSIWRLGAVIFPAGSIFAYLYYAIPAHSADYVGLALKIVELAAIVSALVPLFMGDRMQRRIPT